MVRTRGAVEPHTLTERDASAGQQENKLITALAGVVPVEVIAAHGLILSATTMTDKSGTTTITSASWLQASLPGLILVTVVAYLIGRGLADWHPVDRVRLTIPPLAFVAWTALIGTSALSPWVAPIDHAGLTVVAAIGGVLLVAMSLKGCPTDDLVGATDVARAGEN
jgi:hypothetical protein